jgi:hypothetical protein
MGSQHTRKPFLSRARFAFLGRVVACRGRTENSVDDAPTGAAGRPEIARNGHPGLADTPPAGLSGRLGSEVFARLLLELPEHRRDLQSAYQDGNSEQLARAAHKLLGAVVYCELPELADALRELKRLIVSADAGQTEPAYLETIRLIDELLACSGYRGM